MTKVRFKAPYSADLNNRIAYELVSEEIVYDLDWNGGNQIWKQEHYNLKLLGLVPTYKLETTTDPTDIEAIDIFAKLTNLENQTK